jgi:polygalacturonase
MKIFNKIIKSSYFLIIFFLLACNNKQETNLPTNDIYEGIEFEMPKVVEPVFPDNSVSITDFGAVGDGQTLNSEAFSKAIDKVAEEGGGSVVIPRGIWLTGPIVLKSNINIHVEAGALVIFSTNKELYPMIESNYEGLEAVRCLSPFYGKDLENIAFTGEGVFDGSGGVWRHVKREKMTNSQWEKLLNSGGVTNEKGNLWYPSESFKRGEDIGKINFPNLFDNIEDYKEVKDYLRPVMVSLVNCKNVLFDGPVFQNSPAWCIHPLMCENLMIRNIDVRNPWYSQNGDGIDIESCKNSVIYNCTFDVGDDAVCIKSGRGKEGRDRGVPTENIIVKKCVVYHGHGGVTVGSEMSGGVKNMHVSDCTFMGTDVGLRFKSTRGRGGVVENIYISNIDMINIPTNAISFNLYYGGLSVTEMLAQKDDNKKVEPIAEVTEETPQFKDITIKNVTCKGAYQAIYLQGLPEMNLENVHLENLTMEAENGLMCMDATGITIKNLNLKTVNYPSITLVNTKNVSISGLTLNNAEEPLISVNGENTEDVKIELNSKANLDKLIVLGEKVNNQKVQINGNKK